MAQMVSYTIKEFVELMAQEALLSESECYGKEAELIENLTFNSKAVTEHTLFVCKGATFKEEYLKESVEAGTICYVSEKKYDLGEDVPYIIVNDIRRAMSVLAEKFNNSAWEEFQLIGVTGTKGKSTSVHYLQAILDDYFEANDKKPCGIISSIDIVDGVVTKDSRITTPEAIELHEHFRHAADSNLEVVAMEVSSQALKYNRVDSVKFDIGVFLNISEDHISPIEHPDFEDYFQSKLAMFKQTKAAVVNLDSDFSDRILEAAKECEEIITFSTKDETADFYAYDIRKDEHDTIFRVKGENFDEEFILTMPGLFNVENALPMIAIARRMNVPTEYIYSGLKRARARGRMEFYTTDDNKVIAIVDFAHNKLSFEKIFESIKKEYPDYDIVSVFGCPGNKAFVRRKYLGTIAGLNSTRIILVGDDPGTETVAEICDDIAQYIAPSCPYEVIEERTEGIRKAIVTAERKTVVIIAGKGQESNQRIGNVYVDYPTDAESATRYIAEYNEMHK